MVMTTGVREGYKTTELYELPESWEIKKLIDISDKSDRFSFAGGPFGSNLKTCHYTDCGVRIIQLQNIGDGHFIGTYEVYTSIEKADELKSCNIYPGDIIIAKMAEPVARACIIPANNERYLMCSDGIRLCADRSKYDSRFILYSINSKYFRQNAIAHSTGSTRLRIGLDELRNLDIIIPSFEEQKKIADILSTVDGKIEQTDALIEKTKELKKGLMQQLLTRGIGHTRFKKTELGEIPEEWEVKSIYQVAEIINGGTPSRGNHKFWDKGVIPWATPTDITATDKKYITSTKDYITEMGLQSSSANLLPVGSILMTSRATIGESCINTLPVATNQGFKSIVCKEGLHNEFMYYLISTIKEKLIQLAGGSTFLEVSKNDVSHIKIPIPLIKEQIKIAEIISTTDSQIDIITNERSQLLTLKQGLMQKLLTGQIRVKV